MKKYIIAFCALALVGTVQPLRVIRSVQVRQVLQNY